MTDYAKLQKLFDNLRRQPTVNSEISTESLLRFVKGGDLYHLTDHILSGGEILLCGKVKASGGLMFIDPPNAYEISHYNINGEKIQPPERYAPSPHYIFFFPDASVLNGVSCREWKGSEEDFYLLARGRIHFSQQAAEEHAIAEAKAVGRDMYAPSTIQWDEEYL